MKVGRKLPPEKNDESVDGKNSLGVAPVEKLVIRMSLPAVFGVLAYNIYGILDTAFIAKGVGTDAAGGIAVSFPLLLFLSAVSSTLGGGCASVVSRALGEGNKDKAGRAAANTFGLFWVAALSVTVFGLLFLEELLKGMGVTQSLLPYARAYTKIILFGALTSTAFSSLIRAEGNSRLAMYVWVIPMTVNILLDYLFILQFHWGVKGGAWATVTAQLVSAIMSMHYFLLSGKSTIKIRRQDFKPDMKIIKEILSIGLPSFLQMMGQSIAVIFINRILHRYGGDIFISTYGIVNRINVFLLIPCLGLIQGMQPVVGYNHGAGKSGRVDRTVKISALYAGLYGGILILLILVFSEQLLHIFSNDARVVEYGSYILRLINAGAAFTGIHMVFAAFFQGVGRTGMAMLLSLSNNVLFLLPFILVLPVVMGRDGIWISFPLSAIISSIVSCYFYTKQDRSRKRGIQ